MTYSSSYVSVNAAQRHFETGYHDPINPLPAADELGQRIYQRYCHVYRRGELEELCSKYFSYE